jgi:hypothetical protein
MYVVPELVDRLAALVLDRLGKCRNVLWFAACRISCTDSCGAEAVLAVGPLLAFAGTLGGNDAEAEGVGCGSVSGRVVVLCLPSTVSGASAASSCIGQDVALWRAR